MTHTKKSLPRDRASRQRFDELSTYYEAHRREVMAYALYFTRNDEDAHDALQETFCLALENLTRKEQEIENPRAWLLRIARNVLLRKQDRARQEALLWKKKAEDGFKNSNFSLQVLDGVLAQSITEYIRREFSEPMQEIFILRHYHEMNLAEIAEVTELPVTSIHRMLGNITADVQTRFFSHTGETGQGRVAGG